MAKKICLTDADIQAALEKALKDAKKQKYHGDVNISVPLTSDNRTAELLFTPNAWMQMYALVNSFSTEVEWHGTVNRLDENTFLVDKILIFPHEVASATVTSDQKEYEEWKDGLDDDTFNRCRFHGHSHVNMSVSPSSTDMAYRSHKLGDFCTPSDEDDFFYIFLITNKKGDISAEIYDIKHNALYGTKEIDIGLSEGDESYKDMISNALVDATFEAMEHPDMDVLSDIDEKGRLVLKIVTDVVIGDSTLAEYVETAKKTVTERKYTPSKTYTGYGYGAGYTQANSHSSSLNKTKSESEENKKSEPDWYDRLYYRGSYMED